MSKELEIWQFAAERLKWKQPVMLLIVAESSGSSPGRRGFKMIVTQNDLCGSIGGGVMEVNLVEQARELLPGREDFAPFVVAQEHRKKSTSPSGMICSGKQTVIFFRLASSHMWVVEQIINALQKNERKFLSITPEEISLKMPPEDGMPSGLKQTGDNFIYEETLGHKNKLFIIGGGHCALALSELMARMDFHISLFDDRPNLNTLEKNRYVYEKKIVSSYENIDEFIPPGENTYVVVMTIGYVSDELVIRKLLGKKFRYFGVLGSRAKMRTLLGKLENEGVPREKLAAIRTPVGLQINSQTPEEIAVSIAAEIIAVKNSAK